MLTAITSTAPPPRQNPELTPNRVKSHVGGESPNSVWAGFIAPKVNSSLEAGSLARDHSITRQSPHSAISLYVSYAEGFKR
jgi:hypothetical protein